MGRTMIDSLLRDHLAYIRHLLSESPLPEIRRLRVEYDGTRIFLQGHVRTFYAKQMAQETIRNAVKDMRIVNSVDVD
jgi:hypothetical protein